MQEDRFHGKGKTTLENGDQHLGAYRYKKRSLPEWF
jgi:hypothetical protein